LESKTNKFYEDKRERKTIFSKISEELMYKLTKDKYHKSSSYQYITNDLYINRVVHKADADNNAKIHNFAQRNTEFLNKKKLRLNEKIQKISNEANAEIYGIPNKKVFEKSQLRNAEEFYENQKSFLQQKQQYLTVQRDEALKKSLIAEHGHIPEINENSRSIATAQKSKCVSAVAEEKAEEEVFLRLHNDRNTMKRKQLISADFAAENKNNNIDNTNNNTNSNKDEKKNNKAKSLKKNSLLKRFGKALKLKGLKQSKSEWQGYCTKLHADARKCQERNDQRVQKAYGKAQPSMQCKKTKLMNVKKFVENFENAISKIKIATTDKNNKLCNNNNNNKNKIQLDETSDLNKNNNSKLDFAEFCTLLNILGFTKNDYETIQTNSETILIESEKAKTAEADAEVAAAATEESHSKNQHGFFNAEKNNKDLLVQVLNEKFLDSNKMRNLIKKQIQKEARLIKDSWGILLSHSSSVKNQNQKSSEFREEGEKETAEQKDTLLFLCVVQGLLKGDSHKISAEEENEMQQIRINRLYCEMNKAENKLFKANNEFEAYKKNIHTQNSQSQQKRLEMKGNLKNASLTLTEKIDSTKENKQETDDKGINRFRRARSKDSCDIFAFRKLNNSKIIVFNLFCLFVFICMFEYWFLYLFLRVLFACSLIVFFYMSLAYEYSTVHRNLIILI